MEMLGKLFGGINRVKVMRLFLLNPELILGAREVSKRSKMAVPAANKELRLLESTGFLLSKKRTTGKVWQLDTQFPLIPPLKSILKNDLLDRKKRLIQQFARAGKINLLIIAGVFLDDDDGRTDLLVVGNHLKRTLIGRAVKDLEAEIGKELNYAVLDTSDFQYRMNACDKFVRDIFDYPHSVILDRLNPPVSLTGLSTGH
ncbi:hypothetical protein IT398_00590 [Candidatus Nomurabacteria bacterium]|nr:hypothetical protein [Candidatus Nomurabacteria bacterium]